MVFNARIYNKVTSFYPFDLAIVLENWVKRIYN